MSTRVQMVESYSHNQSMEDKVKSQKALSINKKKNKYCPHSFDKIDERIKGYRQLLLLAAARNDQELKQVFREELRSEDQWKKTCLRSHKIWCLGEQGLLFFT